MLAILQIRKAPTVCVGNEAALQLKVVAVVERGEVNAHPSRQLGVAVCR